MRHGCYYCSMVMQTIDNLGLDIEIKNIWEQDEHELALLDGTGRGVVPVLYYEDDDEKPVWMPESSDIVRFLKAQVA